MVAGVFARVAVAGGERLRKQIEQNEHIVYSMTSGAACGTN